MTYEGFRLTKTEFVEEIKSNAFTFVHEKTKAELISLESDDDNKVFCVSFRTPPKTSDGVAHIIEHSVLNGSKKYPIKEPFVELLKASLYTFLNAMTYPDRTVYPVASRNDQDFHNLMDVYLDAVFFPNLSKETFLQEGWHYKLEDKEAPLEYTGVVYNEMLGASSSPESILYDAIQESLLPKNVYGVNSGGDPAVIPDLTYEGFCDFHDTFYHPSNAKIVIYGNYNLTEKLAHINSYLEQFEYKEIDSKIIPHQKFTKTINKDITYPINESNKEPKSYIINAWRFSDTLDPLMNLSFYILGQILSGSTASPLRKTLIESRLGDDTIEWLESDMLDKFYAIGLSGIDASKQTELETLIDKTLLELSEGISPKTVTAAINSAEFRLREANFGGYSKGLIYAFQMFNAWNYEADAVNRLRYEEPLAQLKERVAEGNYFESLIKEYLIDNPHRLRLKMEPDNQHEARRVQALNDRLSKEKAAMTESNLEQIITENETLKKIQLTPDSAEALATIPKLPLSAINPKSEQYDLELDLDDQLSLSFSEQQTNGVAYLKLYFDASCIKKEFYPRKDRYRFKP